MNEKVEMEIQESEIGLQGRDGARGKMRSRVFCPRGLAILCLAAFWAAASTFGAEQPADLFKQFISSPPPIADMLYETQEPGHPPNFFRLKLQANAMFLADAVMTMGSSNGVGELIDYTNIFAKFDKSYWHKIDRALYLWTDKGLSGEGSNTVKFTGDSILKDTLPSIVNFGVGAAPIGSIRWKDDTFSFENKAIGFVYHGTLVRDAAGRAQSITVAMSKPGSTGEAPGTFPWHYEYSYDELLSLPYLPSRFKMYYVNGDGKEQGVRSVRIHSLTVAPQPLPESAFSLQPLLADTNMGLTITVSNAELVFTPKNEKPYLVADSIAKAPDRRKMQQLYFVMAVLLFSIPFIFLLLKRREQN
jgi:hypothetical protein